MPLILTEEQQMLKQSASEFLRASAPVEQLRLLRDSKDAKGYDTNTWSQMVEMGWTAMVIPEAYEGLGFGYTGLGQILEESGRTLTASPLFATVVLGTGAILHSHNKAIKEAVLPRISAGELKLALAHEETHTHKALPTVTTFQTEAGHYVINGMKNFVLDGHIADLLIVTARTDEEDASKIGLFLVDAKTEGVSITRKRMMDSRNAAEIRFDRVQIDSSKRLDDGSDGAELLERVLDIGRICLSAEMLGTSLEAFERTIAYIQERRQFGVSIGSFQGLQHRAAHAFCELELCKTLILKALHAIDETDKLSTIASMTKAKMGEVAQLVTNEAIQMYGGIGVTDEEEIGFFMKRARVAQRTLGDYNFHLDRFASLKEF